MTMNRPQAEGVSAPTSWRPYLLATASGLAFWACFFPMNWGWLAWFALAPMVHFASQPATRQKYLAVWVGGLAFAILAVQWVRHASPTMVVAWAGLALFISLQFPLWLWGTRLLIQGLRIPLLLAAPMAWVFLEYLRAQIDIGFAWYYLGHTQHDYLAVVQVADLFGAAGVSFLVMMANVAVYQLAAMWLRRGAGQRSPWRDPLVNLGAVGVLLAATLAYGAYKLGESQFEEGPRIALVQGSVPMEMKDDSAATSEVLSHYLRLAEQASEHRPDLIVWPETSFPYWWQRVDPSIEVPTAPLEWQKWHQESELMAKDLAELHRTLSLVGLNSQLWRPEGAVKLNSALFLDAQGNELGRYDKCCPVPFGEYLPLRDVLPFMQWLSPYDFDYSIAVGRYLTIFEMPGERAYRFAALICYEDTVPRLGRWFLQAAGDERPLDFFVNVSNDGWFRCSEEHEQHLVGARFRAIECRRAMARAVNMGISAIIDGNGRILALPGPTWRTSKGITGVVHGRVPVDHRSSLYAYWGDVLPLTCGLALLLGAIVATVWRGQPRTNS